MRSNTHRHRDRERQSINEKKQLFCTLKNVDKMRGGESLGLKLTS